MRFTHSCRSSPISTRWHTASTSRPSPARASLSWHWWVVLHLGCYSKGVGLMWRGASLSGGVEASQASTADWQTVCSLFHRLGYHKTSTMLQQCADRAWVDARLFRKTDFIYVQFLQHTYLCYLVTVYRLFLSFLHLCSYTSYLCLCLHSWPILCPPPITLRFCGIWGERGKVHAVRITGFTSALTPLHQTPRGPSQDGKKDSPCPPSTQNRFGKGLLKRLFWFCGNEKTCIPLFFSYFSMSHDQNLCKSMLLFLAEVWD